MFRTTSETITQPEADALAADVVMTSVEALAPMDVKPRRIGSIVTDFRILPSFPEAVVKSGPDLPTVAHAIADQLTTWSEGLSQAAAKML